MIKKIARNYNSNILYLNYNMKKNIKNEKSFNIFIVLTQNKIVEYTNDIFNQILNSFLNFNPNEEALILYPYGNIINKFITNDVKLESKIIYDNSNTKSYNNFLSICNGEKYNLDKNFLYYDFIKAIKDEKSIINNKKVNLFIIIDTDNNNEIDKQKSYSLLKELSKEINLINLSSLIIGNNIDEEFLNKLSSLFKFNDITMMRYISDIYKNIIDSYNSVYNYNPEEFIRIDFSKDVSSDILYINGNKCSLIEGYERNILNLLNDNDNKFYIRIKSEISENDYIKINDEEFNLNSLSKLADRMLIKPSYGFAKEYYKKNLNYDAIDSLMIVKDKEYIDNIFNAYTLEDRFLTLIDLELAYKNNSYRHVDTCQLDYIGDFNDFCVLDILDDLNKVGAEFIPLEDCEYSDIRIGKQRKDLLKGTFKRDYDFDITPNMEDLIFNQSRLNISINYKIPGYIEISDEDIKKYNFNNTRIPVSKFRNQTIIKDGVPNMNSIKVSITPNQINNLRDSFKKYLDRYCSYNPKLKIYTIMLNKLPITNRKRANNLNEDDILHLTEELIKAKARQKVYNAEIKDNTTHTSKMIIDNSGSFNKLEFNEEQINCLKENYGVNSRLEYVGKFNNEDELIGESYEMLTFEFKIKGSTSIPTINKFKEKLEKGKTLNLLEIEMKKAYDIVDKINISKISENQKKEKLLTLKNNNKKDINKNNKVLFKSKFSKIITGGWWNFEVDSKGNEIYSNPKISDSTLIIKVNKEKVEL